VSCVFGDGCGDDGCGGCSPVPEGRDSEPAFHPSKKRSDELFSREGVRLGCSDCCCLTNPIRTGFCDCEAIVFRDWEARTSFRI
jgi:hypothetical protein